MIAIMITFTGCLDTSDTVTNTSLNIDTSSDINTSTEIIPEPTPIELSGIGQRASQKFNLEKGLSTFRLTHTGSSNFSVWLMNADGQQIELLVNEIGKFDGSKAVGINKSNLYLLDISADGEWSIEVE